MAIIDKAGACVALAAVLLVASGAHAASHAAKCEAAKLKAAGKYDFCRLLAEQKAVLQGGLPDYSACNTSLSRKWSAAETHFGMACPTSGDLTLVQNKATAEANATALQLAGTRFVDNGDGTVTDTQTGLMWEKKTPRECVFTPVPGFPIACMTDNDCVNNGGGGVCTCGSDPHCVLATYAWSTGTNKPDGTAFTTFLYGLNGGTSPDGVVTSGCFTGHCDWRLPTVEELRGIVDFSAAGCAMGGPCIDPTFGPTQPDLYWSATTEAGFSPPDVSVWMGFFGDNMAAFDSLKIDNRWYIRAVRGGL
jgi:hypothetical protein